ncbi:MAG: peptide chain release factor N(5)-glutamine methyltransferase [Spirochaetota bacterium]
MRIDRKEENFLEEYSSCCRKKVQDIIAEARGIVSHVDIYCLLEYTLKRSKEFIFTYPEYELTPQELKRWRRVIKRRMESEPAAYITGRKEFYSLNFRVNRHTMIPRPETELLVDEVIRRNPETLLDVGTGSGCIAIAVSYHLPECRITAVDISVEALRLAKKNAAELLENNSIRFLRSNIFENLEGEKFDVIVSNPPYVKSDALKELPDEVVLFEPVVALDGGKDGLNSYRNLLKDGWKFLNPGGVMVLEISPELREGVEYLSASKGYRVLGVSKDLYGLDRMIVVSGSE